MGGIAQTEMDRDERRVVASKRREGFSKKYIEFPIETRSQKEGRIEGVKNKDIQAQGCRSYG